MEMISRFLCFHETGTAQGKLNNFFKVGVLIISIAILSSFIYIFMSLKCFCQPHFCLEKVDPQLKISVSSKKVWSLLVVCVLARWISVFFFFHEKKNDFTEKKVMA